jgi:hypothetical protein
LLCLFSSLSKLLSQRLVLFSRRVFLARLFIFAAVLNASNRIGVLHQCSAPVDTLGFLLLSLLFLLCALLLALGGFGVLGFLLELLGVDGGPEVLCFCDAAGQAQFIVKPVVVDDLDGAVFEGCLHFGDSGTPVGFADDEVGGVRGKLAVIGGAIGFGPLLQSGCRVVKGARETNDGVLELGSHDRGLGG